MSITINRVIIVVIDKSSLYVTIGMENISGAVRNEETISGSRKINKFHTFVIKKKIANISWWFFIALRGFGLQSFAFNYINISENIVYIRTWNICYLISHLISLQGRLFHTG